jgi:hypothetical protein
MDCIAILFSFFFVVFYYVCFSQIIRNPRQHVGYSTSCTILQLNLSFKPSNRNCGANVLGMQCRIKHTCFGYLLQSKGICANSSEDSPLAYRSHCCHILMATVQPHYRVVHAWSADHMLSHSKIINMFPRQLFYRSNYYLPKI